MAFRSITVPLSPALYRHLRLIDATACRCINLVISASNNSRQPHSSRPNTELLLSFTSTDFLVSPSVVCSGRDSQHAAARSKVENEPPKDWKQVADNVIIFLSWCHSSSNRHSSCNSNSIVTLLKGHATVNLQQDRAEISTPAFSVAFSHYVCDIANAMSCRMEVELSILSNSEIDICAYQLRLTL